jgi:hypothetical protein
MARARRRSRHRLSAARLLRRAGFEVREINPLLRLARPGSSLWDWPDTFFDIYPAGTREDASHHSRA